MTTKPDRYFLSKQQASKLWVTHGLENHPFSQYCATCDRVHKEYLEDLSNGTLEKLMSKAIAQKARALEQDKQD